MASDVKWIKIYIDMINNKKIKRIRKMPEGNNIILIWVFLLTTAGESNKNGALFLTDTIPFTEEDLAIEFDFEVSVIKFSLITLEKFGMIEIFDSVIFIKNWSEYQNIEGMDKIREQTRIRVAKHREKKVGLLDTVEEKKCSYCGSCEEITIEHLIPKSKGGEDKEYNCVFACKSCNMRKTNKDLDVFINESLLLKENININLILSNKKIMNLINLNNGRFYMKCNAKCNVTNVTSNETELDKELELELELDKDIKEKKYVADFDLFWSNYPKKVQKLNANKSWKKIKFTEELFNKIIESLNKQKQSINWLKDNGQFIPNASTWLNGERWNDELEQAQIKLFNSTDKLKLL